MDPPRALLLDLDGTLIDASAAIVDGVQAVAAEMGLPVPDRAWARSRIGRPPREVWEQLGCVDVDGAMAAFGRHVRPTLAAAARVLPGVRDTLAALHAGRVPLAVATTRLTDSAQQTLDVTGLAPFVSQVSGRDVVPHPKPAPDVLLHALAALRLLPSQAVMVGDSVADVEAARAAGMPCWAVLGGVDSENTLRAAGANLILGDGLRQVLRVLSTA